MKPLIRNILAVVGGRFHRQCRQYGSRQHWALSNPASRRR